MNNVHIEFADEYLTDLDIDIGEVDEEADVSVLSEWYSRAEELIAEISDDVDFKRSVDRATDEWIWRAGRKIAYLKKGLRRIEQRILRLGEMPPYRLNDGRAQAIQGLQKKVAQARDALLSNGIPLPWEKAPRDRDGTRSAETACPAPVPQDCHARAEGIAQIPPQPLDSKDSSHVK